jgi:CheY-like chemotaxis protein/HD-like signal output (HDOD) protein
VSLQSASAPAGRVLVIDDEEEIRTLLERQLRRLGYEVGHATNGQGGLEAALHSQPQVIITDLRMPGMDGHTLLRRLAAAGADIAVIVMSGQGNMEDVIDVLRAGAVDYLRKPWSSADLAAAVERGMERFRQRQPGVAAPAPPEPRSGGEDDPFRQMLARLRSGELPIPATPAVVEALRSAVQRPNVDLDQIVALIERDQRLATDVLRLANTAHYARGGRILSIKVAVSRIGFRQLHAIVETIVLRGLFQTENADIRRLITQVWRSSVARAIVMRELTAVLGQAGRRVQVSADAAYLVGLMADIGAAFMLGLADQRKGVGLGVGAARDQIAAVHANHQEVGAALLGRWLTDPLVVAAVADHHPKGPDALTDYHRMMVIASEVVKSLPGALDVTARPPPTALVDKCLTDLQLTRAHLSALSASAA